VAQSLSNLFKAVFSKDLLNNEVQIAFQKFQSKFPQFTGYSKQDDAWGFFHQLLISLKSELDPLKSQLAVKNNLIDQNWNEYVNSILLPQNICEIIFPRQKNGLKK